MQHILHENGVTIALDLPLDRHSSNILPVDVSEPQQALIGSAEADGFMMSPWWVTTISNTADLILILTLPCSEEGKEGGHWSQLDWAVFKWFRKTTNLIFFIFSS